MARFQNPASFSFPANATYPASRSTPTAMIQPGSSVFCFEGDSLTANNNNGITPYPDKLVVRSGWLNKGASFNIAITGDTIQNMVLTYPDQIAPIKFPSCSFKDFYLFIWAGTNDFGTRSSAQIYSDLTSLWSTAKAAGWKVVAFTISKRAAPNALTGPQETARQAVNTSIRGDLTQFNYLADVDSWFPDASDLTYYYDGLHNTDAGTLLIANNTSLLFSP